MADVFVREGNRVEHNGTAFEAGEKVTDLSDKEAQALLDAGVVGSKAQSASSEASTGEGAPSAEQIQADAEQVDN